MIPTPSFERLQRAALAAIPTRETRTRERVAQALRAEWAAMQAEAQTIIRERQEEHRAARRLMLARRHLDSNTASPEQRAAAAQELALSPDAFDRERVRLAEART